MDVDYEYIANELKEFAKWMIAFHYEYLESKGIKEEFHDWLRVKLDNNEEGLKGRFEDWLDEEVRSMELFSEIIGKR